jgi:Cd2+/Zn2+-exporting ATPase
MSTTDTELTFQIRGMDCPSCARSIEAGLSQLEGVRSCELNFTTEKLRVTGTADREAITTRVRELGYEAAEPVSEPKPGAQPSVPPSVNFWQFMCQRHETRLALWGALLILPGLLFKEILGWDHPFINVASIGALIVAGSPIARSAWRALKINHEININVLMTIASIGAVFIGAYTEAGMVMVLFAIGEALEGYTAGRAREAIRSLMQVVPGRARRLSRQAGRLSEEEVPVEALQVGDVILVKPGERIPMDGRVVAGASSVNQAPITGESQLVDKEAGAEVFASSINGQGALEIEITRLAADNTISRLIKMVEEAQEKRAPAQRFIDHFARYYTPAVVVLAILVAAIPPLFFNQPFLSPDAETHGWLYRGLALLVVACPCALVISTPVSIISAISNAARHGVLFKGGAYLETLSKVKTMAFDKTGTLTLGKPAVVTIRSAACLEPATNLVGQCAACNDLLALASAVEQRSEHPLAQAIVSESSRRGLADKYLAAAQVRALMGRGVTGQVDGRAVTLGSHAYFDACIPHAAVHCQEAQNEAARGYTPIMVSTEGTYLGTIAVADTVRDSSRRAMLLLKQAGIKTLVMLTGDNTAVAQAIGRQLGLTEVRSELLPEDKVSAIESLQQASGPVAMIGDGINDAPALATAAVGIAIGGAAGGTTQAMETADVTLMSDDLRQLPFAFKLSRTAMRTIQANVILSLGIKLVFLILVLLGWGTMWMAVLADVGTSLLVTLNGMRLLNHPKSQ